MERELTNLLTQNVRTWSSSRKKQEAKREAGYLVRYLTAMILGTTADVETGEEDGGGQDEKDEEEEEGSREGEMENGKRERERERERWKLPTDRKPEP